MKRFKQIPVFPLIAGGSLLVGRLIPSFYDWTDSDQSRPSPLIWQSAVGLLLCGTIACLALPWLRIEYHPPASRVGKHQFTVRTLLVITTVVAIAMLAFRSMPLLAVAGSLLGIAFYYVVEFGALRRSYRWPVVSLLACLYFPYAWTVSLSHFLSGQAELWWMVSLPGFFMTMLAGSLVHQHVQELAWLSMLVTAAELVLGIGLIRLGPRRFIAYLVFVSIASIFGSFILNMLMRI